MSSLVQLGGQVLGALSNERPGVIALLDIHARGQEDELGALLAEPVHEVCDEPFCGDVAVARPPNLRAELTAVWAAAWPRDPGRSLALALWRADRQGWAVLEPPLVRS
jgi:hypothetical protein